jgi:hypothetical protein
VNAEQIEREIKRKKEEIEYLKEDVIELQEKLYKIESKAFADKTDCTQKDVLVYGDAGLWLPTLGAVAKWIKDFPEASEGKKFVQWGGGIVSLDGIGDPKNKSECEKNVVYRHLPKGG